MWEKIKEGIKKEYGKIFKELKEEFDIIKIIKSVFGLKYIYMDVYSQLNENELRLTFKILSHLFALIVVLFAIPLFPLLFIVILINIPLFVIIDNITNKIKDKVKKIVFK